MGVLADLVPKQQPAGLVDVTENAGGVEGATWRIPIVDVTDNNGDSIDLSGVTASCIIQDGVDGAEIAELGFTGYVDGRFDLYLSADDTEGLAGTATTTNPRDCRWSLIVSDGTDKVQFWGPLTAHFYIFPAGATV